jgi:hypothetical protein
MIRIVSSFHLDMIQPQRLFFWLIGEYAAFATNSKAATQWHQYQHDNSNALQRPHFQTPRGSAEQEGFGGRTFNNGLDSQQTCDQRALMVLQASF